MQYFIAIFVVFRPRPSGPAYLAAGPFITASHPRLSFFVTKKGRPKNSMLLYRKRDRMVVPLEGCY